MRVVSLLRETGLAAEEFPLQPSPKTTVYYTSAIVQKCIDMTSA